MVSFCSQDADIVFERPLRNLFHENAKASKGMQKSPCRQFQETFSHTPSEG
jgi:hypothetical protein